MTLKSLDSLLMHIKKTDHRFQILKRFTDTKPQSTQSYHIYFGFTLFPEFIKPFCFHRYSVTLTYLHTKKPKKMIDVNSTPTGSNCMIFHCHSYWRVVVCYFIILWHCRDVCVDISKSRAHMPRSTGFRRLWVSCGMDKMDVIFHQKYEIFILWEKIVFLNKSMIVNNSQLFNNLVQNWSLPTLICSYSIIHFACKNL